MAVKEIPDDNGGTVTYYSCPIACVPISVWEWNARYMDIEKFPHTAKPYDDRGDRWHAFEGYYMEKLHEYRERLKREG